MTSYYNEIDKNAAQWIRNLIASGHIAHGEVDERSIEDVCPNDIRGFTQCHFFAGVAVWSYALRQAGWSDDRPVWTGSCPCQPFSAAGKGKGFADERHLWPAFHHLIKECKPAVIFGEQVASKAVEPWIDLVHADLEAMGYAFGCVPFPAAGVGAPHIRDRAYWVADADGQWGRDGRRVHRGCIEKSSRSEKAVRGKLWNEIEGIRIAGGLAHTQQHDSGCQTEPANHAAPQADRPADWTGGCGVSLGGMADTYINGCEPWREGIAPMGYGQAPGSDSGIDRPGPTNGFWRDADWLGCRDGKWRPVESGLKPLASGAAARVVRLRAYGNSICAPVAQAFIESVMDWSAA